MFRAFRSVASGAVLALAAVLFASPAVADSFVYTEVIEDFDNTTFFLFDVGQDLGRLRVLGDGTVDVTGNDATIFAENDASGFGLSSIHDISWTHTFIGIPPAQQFISASVEITAYGASGESVRVGRRRITIANDIVSVEGTEIGVLDPGGAFSATTTLFDLGSPVEIGVLLADGKLEVTVSPEGPGIFGLPVDAISIQRSEFVVEYRNFEATTPNTAFVLFGGGTDGQFATGFVNILNLGGLTDTAPFPNIILGNSYVLPPPPSANQQFFLLGGGDFTGFSPHVMMGVETDEEGSFQAPSPIDPVLQFMIVQGLATIGALDPALQATGGFVEGIPTDVLINHILSFDPTPGTFTYEQVEAVLFDDSYTEFSDGMGDEVVFFFDPTNSGTLNLVYPITGGALTVTYTPQPEPGSLLLLGGALAGFAFYRRRRARR